MNEWMDPLIPLWLKISYSGMVAVILPIYYVRYGPGNFLWFSDIALIVTVATLWLESPLLASMMAISVLLPEIVWTVSYVAGLLAGRPVTGLAGYMFDRDLPLYLRGLSLFHLILPPLLLWLVYRLGYDGNALPAQICLAWIILPLTYWLTDKDENVTWVHGPAGKVQKAMPAWTYLLLLMAAFPLLVYLPTHLLLQNMFG